MKYKFRFDLLVLFFSISNAFIISDVFAKEPLTQLYQRSPAAAESKNSQDFGLGVMFGDPTGLTGKYWLSNRNALAFGLTYSFGDYFEFLADYLWHFPNALNSLTKGKISTEFALYMGAGGAFFVDSRSVHTPRHFFQSDTNNSNVGLGLRIPFGMEYLPRNLPVGVFLELVPGVGVVPIVFGFFQWDIGIRYYF